MPEIGEPLIIASNHDTPNNTWHFRRSKDLPAIPHTHSVDHLLIGAFIKRKIHTLASVRHYRNPFKRKLLDVLEQIPATREGIDISGRYFDRREAVLIFPEGNSGQGSLMGKAVEVHPGLGRLVEAYPNVRVLPHLR